MSSMMMLVVLLAVTVTTVIGYNDLLIYDITTQAKCKEVTRGPTRNCIWAAGLNLFADKLAENGGRVIAYKIKWFGGSWSGYVPGYNDMDGKFNIRTYPCKQLPFKTNTLRRKWGYFYDHIHKFILCEK